MTIETMGIFPYLCPRNYVDLYSHLESFSPSRKIHRVGAYWHGNGSPYLRFRVFINTYYLVNHFVQTLHERMKYHLRSMRCLWI
jgi:hypothetical protein